MTLTLTIILIPQVSHSKGIRCSTVRKAPFYLITLILNVDLDIVKMSHTKIKFLCQIHSKVIALTDR